MAEPYIIKMPQLSDTMTEGVVVGWEKQPGDKVERGDVVAQVETDKAIMDVEVFREGYLSGPLAAVDSTIPVGAPMAYLVASPEDVRSEGEPPSREVAVGERSVESEPEAEGAASIQPVEQDTTSPDAPEGHTIKMPQLSDTMTEGVVVGWEKQPGDKVERGDVVAQVETDKAIMDVEVFREGYLSGPLAPVDSVIPVGAAMGYLVAEPAQVIRGEAAVQPRPTPTSTEPEPKITALPRQPSPPKPGPKMPARRYPPSAGGVPAPRPRAGRATPYARKLAAEYQVDLDAVSGTGPDGTIYAEDVVRVGGEMRAVRPEVRPGDMATLAELTEVPVPGEGRPMNSMERAISRSMASSVHMPTFHVTVNARPEALIAAAKQRQVSVTVAIAKACALAIQDQPAMNWAYQPVDKLVERNNIDIGMAVAAEGGGLVVPVLRGCERRGVEELNVDWQDLVERARKKRLAPDEYANPTFMVSNMGMLGVAYFDAIPTPGTAAILAISSASEDGMPLTVTADHRVVNGAMVAMFLNSLKSRIEAPAEWLGLPGPAVPEGDWDYEVVVLGGGPGGEDCARELAAHGMRVAMINDAPLPGGECLWRGCIPSKTWRAAADRIRDRVHDAHLGVEGTTKPRLNWGLLEATRRHVLEVRGQMAQKTDTGVKIKLIQGFARFEGEHVVSVDSSGNVKDPHRRPHPGSGKKLQRLSFGCAIVATGAPPYVPPIPGAAEGVASGGVLTSDTVWGLDSPPKKLAVVGGGAIGVEMAQIFQDFGSQVILVEAQERLLAEVDEEVATQLGEILAKEPRLTIHTTAKVVEIKGKPGSMKLVFEDAAGKRQTQSCNYVLVATGKRPDLDALQLEKAGIATEQGAIKVDSRCRTNVPYIFAVGDVNGGLMLAHTAAQQGRVAAAAILSEDLRYDMDKDCGVIFTRPQAAFVGLSLAQAKARNVDAVEVKVPLSIDAKAMITAETSGLIKLVAEKTSHRIIGVHLLADHADTLIGEAVMLVSAGMSLEQLASAIHPHPTQTELFGDLARRLLSRLRRSTQRAKRQTA